MNTRDILRYGFVFLTFLGTFSTYPKATYDAIAEAPTGDIISIVTAQDFQDINLDLTADYEIANDIDFNGFILSPLAPLASAPFTGTIDGNGFTLSNILIDLPNSITSSSANFAMMMYNNGTIRDLNLTNIKFESSLASPALVTNPSGYGGDYSFSHFIYENQVDGVIENVSLRFTTNQSIGLTLDPSFTEVAETKVYNSIFVHKNLGEISGIDFHLSSTYQFDFIASEYYFSFIYENAGDISSVDLQYEPTALSWKAEDILSISFFVYNNTGSATLIKLSVMSETNVQLRNGDALDTTIANLAILNSGLLDEVYVHTDYALVFDDVHDIRYAGLVDWNQAGGVVSNVYVISDVTFVFFNFNNSVDPVVNTQHYAISGLINKNEATLQYFYQVGTFNLVFQYVHEETTTTALISRISNGSEDVPGLIEFGISSLAIHIISLATEDNFLTVDDFYNAAPGNNFQIFSTIDEVNFFKLNEAFVESYTVETDGDPETNTYISQSDTFVYVEAHYVSVPSLEITDATYFSILTTKALFTNVFATNANWTNQQVSSDGAWVLKDVNKITFALNNFTIQNIGVSYVVTSDAEVFENDVKRTNGTHILTETGAYLFKLVNPNFGIEQYVSILVFETDHNLTNSGTTYTGTFTPSFGEDMTATLNGNAYTLGTPVTQPGDHTLVVSGLNGYAVTYTFSISLVVTGVAHLGNYTSTVTPVFSGGTATLNGAAFTSNTPITAVGSYTLIITGRPGFTSTYTFTIAHTTTNLSNNQVYQAGFIPNVVGEGATVTLNGSAYTLGTAITLPGDHTLVVAGLNGYSVTYNFSIDLVITGLAHLGSYTSTVTPIFSGGTATLNGSAFTSNTAINAIGNHTLIITGRPGFTSTYTFTIASTSTNFTNGDVKAPNFIPAFFGQSTSATLNGNAYTLGTAINLPGDHTLVVSGLNGYSITYNFSITLVVTGLVNSGIYTTTVIPVFSGGTATLNGSAFASNTAINAIGNHTLIITGRPGFTRTFTFTIASTSTNFSNGDSNAPNFIPTFFGEGTTATLNGNAYSLGTAINLPGTHTLIILGANGYSLTYNFSITLVVTGVANSGNYTTTVTPVFSGGTATLNGSAFTSNTAINAIGNHTLIITGRPGFTSTYTFTIASTSTNFTNGDLKAPNFVPAFFGEGITATLNGTPYIIGTAINEVGNHTILVSGLNAYSITYTFTIRPSTNNLVNNQSYEPNFIPNLGGEGMTATLNGNVYVIGTEINFVGNYTLVVSGLNEYSITYTFKIKPSTNNLVNDQSYEPNFIPNLVGEGMTATLNGTSYIIGTAINLPGNHVLLVSGLNNYSITYTFSVNLVVNGVNYFGNYTTTVTPVFSGGTATLNGSSFESNTAINAIGNHTLVIRGRPGFIRTYTFTIASTSTNFSNGDAKAPNFVPTFFGQSTNATLNGTSYSLGTAINVPGDHTLVIFGLNAYSLSYNFSIELVISGFIDGTTYTTAITPTFSGGTATINDQVFTSNTVFNRIGNHILIIRGRPGFTETFTFTIASTSTNFTNGDSKAPNFIPSFFGDGMTATLNDVSYNLRTGITQPGEHTLIIFGANDYSLSYNFSIELTVSGFTNNTTYSTPVIPVFSGGTATLNGQPFTSETSFNRIGNHTLTITGRPGFTRTFTFTIEPVINFNHLEILYTPVTVDFPNAERFEVNGKNYTNAKRVQIQGVYEVTVFGAGNYSFTFTFKYMNPNLVSVQSLYLPMLLTGVGTIGIFFLRRRLVR